MRIKKFDESVNSDSELGERLKDSLTSISDEREITIGINRSTARISKSIFFNVRIDDLICFDKRVLFTSETKSELGIFSNSVLNILESIKEALERCEIDYEFMDFEISSTSHDSDGDEVDIPQTLFARVVFN